MGIEVNTGHRSNPFHRIIHNPTLHRVLKVTGVALAALAVFAGVVALSLFIAPAFAALVLPTVVVSVILMVAAGKKSPNHHDNFQPVQPGPGLLPAVRQAQGELNPVRPNHLPQNVQLGPDWLRLAGGTNSELGRAYRNYENELQRSYQLLAEADRAREAKARAMTQELTEDRKILKGHTQEKYRERIGKVISQYQEFKKSLTGNIELSALNSGILLTYVQSLEEFYRLEAQVGADWDLASIERETDLESCLRKIFKSAQAQSEKATGEDELSFLKLKNAVRIFSKKHNMNLVLDVIDPSESSSEQEESVKFQEAEFSSDSSEDSEGYVVSLYTAATDASRDVMAFRNALEADQNLASRESGMHAAALNGFAAAIKMLHDKGVSLEHKDTNGSTPFRLIIEKLLRADLSTKEDLKEVEEVREVLVSQNNARFAIPSEKLTEQDFLKEAANALLDLGAVRDDYCVPYCDFMIKKLEDVK